MRTNMIDKVSYIIAVITLVFGFFLFYSQTDEIVGSFAAACLAAALAWVSYVLMRWLVLALK